MSALLKLHTPATSGEPPGLGSPTTLFFSFERTVCHPDGEQTEDHVTVKGSKNADGVMFLMVFLETWSGLPDDMYWDDTDIVPVSESNYARLHRSLHRTFVMTTGHHLEHSDGVSLHWEMMRDQGTQPHDVPLYYDKNLYGGGRGVEAD